MKKIYSDKKFLPKTRDNEFYYNDLIGCHVHLKDKSNVGMVLNVQNYGAGDLLETKFNKKIVLIPFNKTNIISINTIKKEIIADPIKGIF